MSHFRSLASLLCLVAFSAAARADSVLTYVTGTDTYTINVADSPVPASVNGVASFSLNANVTLNGNTTTDLITFSNTAALGGFADPSKGIAVHGAQLFSGTLSAPTFLTGSFNMYSDVSLLTKVGVVTCAPAAAPAAVTPEPSSLMLLGTGLLSVAAAARRRILQ